MIGLPSAAALLASNTRSGRIQEVGLRLMAEQSIAKNQPVLSQAPLAAN